MNIKILSAPEMTTVSASWLGDQRALFLSIPEIAPLLGQIQQAHQGLLETSGQIRAGQAQADLTRQLADVDARHDAAIRGVWHVLNGTIHCMLAMEDPPAAGLEELEQLRDVLLPEGLSYTNRTYREQAGNALHMQERLSAADRAVLERLPVFGKATLADVVNRWAALAKQLGDLERRRLLIEDSTADRPSEFQARMAWAQVAEVMLTVMGVSRAPAQAINAIRQPLLEAVAAAERRAAEAQKSGSGAKAEESGAAKTEESGAP